MKPIIETRASMIRTRENPASFPAAMVAARWGFSNSTGTLMVAVPNLKPAVRTHKAHGRQYEEAVAGKAAAAVQPRVLSHDCNRTT